MNRVGKASDSEAFTPEVVQSVSLRKRKKARQRTDLLLNAAELFRQKGYEETRMEDIATRAIVSTKTVYNYFPAKQQILIELLDQDRDRLRADYELVVAAPPDDPGEALALLIRADVGDVRSSEDKRLWRELLAAATRGHDRAKDEFESNRKTFTRYIEKLLKHYIQNGKLVSVLPLRIAVDIVYAVNAYDFREYCASESMTADDVLKLARKQMKILVGLWKPNSVSGQRAEFRKGTAAKR